MAIDLIATPLKCPGCGNDDKDLMIVFTMDWHRAGDLSLVEDAERTPPEPGDTVECRCPVEDDADPVCHYRDALENFALAASGVEIAAHANSALHGSHLAPPSAPSAANGKPARKRQPVDA